MRANLLDELNKPYVVTARAKGMREWRLVLRYPVRLAFNPLISTIGWYLPMLFSGSLIVATVMNLPNIGPLLLRALVNQDMYLAGGILLIYSFLTIVGTLLSDILLALVDPRIRVGDEDGRRPSSRPSRAQRGAVEGLFCRCSDKRGPRLRFARSDDGNDMTAADITVGKEAEDRIAVASNWKLVWWRFRRHHLAMASAVLLIFMYIIVLVPDFFSTQDPERTDARQAFIPVQTVHLFDDGGWAPWVPAIVGKRNPTTLRMEWTTRRQEEGAGHLLRHRLQVEGLRPVRDQPPPDRAGRSQPAHLPAGLRSARPRSVVAHHARHADHP